MTEMKTESAVEVIKRASNYLRGGGNLASDLANDQPNVTNGSEQLLKFHGVVKGDLRELAQSLDRQFLSSSVSSGDTATS